MLWYDKFQFVEDSAQVKKGAPIQSEFSNYKEYVFLLFSSSTCRYCSVIHPQSASPTAPSPRSLSAAAGTKDDETTIRARCKKFILQRAHKNSFFTERSS
jgi:hypothetical protein